MVKVLDPSSLAPDGFLAQLNECLDFLPFKPDEEIKVCVKEHNFTSDALASNSTEYFDEGLQMAITLFARDIDDKVLYNRVNYWLFITLHEFAHIYLRHQVPEVGSHNLEDECNRIAHDTLQVYKEHCGGV